MKALIVLSEVTYVPKNYCDFLEEILANSHEHVAAVCLLNTLSPSLLKTLAGLYVLGAPHLATQLVKNILMLPRDPRKKICKEHDIPFICTASMNSPEMISWVKANKIDVIVNARTRCFYKKEILAAPLLGCVNVHHGLLPHYRGTMCDLFALSDGREAGFSVHLMNEKLDDGLIYHTQVVSKAGEKDFMAHLSRGPRLEGRALADFLSNVARDGRLPVGLPNLSKDASYTKTPRNKEGIQKLKQNGVHL